MARQAELHARSLKDPEGFWGEQAGLIDWIEPWTKVLDSAKAPYFYRWFAGAVCNSCYNALDRHVEAGHGERAALIYDSPLTDKKSQLTYKELLARVARMAGAIEAQGLQAGDRAIIYMPMIPEAVIAMLACARLGVIHSVVFGGFASNELATRIKDAAPRMILTASCGLEPGKVISYQPLVEGALELAPGLVEKVIVFDRPQEKWSLKSGRDLDWMELESGSEEAACVPVKATDPLYILYTSGTTGQPKGVIRDNGGHMVALAWSMKYIYNISPGEVFWAASDVGWVVGHSYIVYAPLFIGATTLLYEGKPVGTPDAGAFWRVISEHKVASLFTAPTAFRAIKKEDPDGKLIGDYDLSHFRALFLAGERCDPDTLHWATQKLSVPVIDHWWQTETGWSIAANCLGIEQLPIKPGSPACAVPGYDLVVLDADHKPRPVGEMGDICVKLPLPPSCLPSLWQADQRFIDSYLSAHPGYYTTGDAGFIDEDGYIYVMSRTDDIINVAGHRLSTGAMEEVLAGHPDIAECAVIGVEDAMKGQLPMGFLVLKSGNTRPESDIVAEAIKRVRDQIGPVAAFKLATVVPRLPKTRSGKILRATMAKIANGEAKEPGFKIPATIDDPAILDEITTALQQIGYPQK